MTVLSWDSDLHVSYFTAAEAAQERVIAVWHVDYGLLDEYAALRFAIAFRFRTFGAVAANPTLRVRHGGATTAHNGMLITGEGPNGAELLSTSLSGAHMGSLAGSEFDDGVPAVYPGTFTFTQVIPNPGTIVQQFAFTLQGLASFSPNFQALDLVGVSVSIQGLSVDEAGLDPWAIFSDDVYAGPRIREYHQLGSGIVRPFYRAEHGDFCNDSGVNTVMSNVGQILGTDQGLLPWRTEFGSALQRLRHQANVPVVRDVARAYVREALGRWDPRVQLRQLTVDTPASATQNQVTLRGVVSIDGQEGGKRLDIPGFRLEEWAVPEQIMAWSAAGRVPRGMGYLAQSFGERESAEPEPFVVGLMRPFERMGKDFRHGSGIKEILSNVGQVLGTYRKSLPWRTELGSSLEELRHKASIPELRDLAAVYVADALGWEPRANLVKVENVQRPRGEENVVEIRALTKISLFEEATTYPLNITLKSQARGTSRFKRIATGSGSGERGGGSAFTLVSVFPPGLQFGAPGYEFERQNYNSSYTGPLILTFSRPPDPATLTALAVSDGDFSPPSPWAGPETMRVTYHQNIPSAKLPLTFEVVGDTIEIGNSAGNEWGFFTTTGGAELWIQLTAGLHDVDGNPLTNHGDAVYWLFESDDF